MIKFFIMLFILASLNCFAEVQHEIITDRSHFIVGDKHTPFKGEFSVRHQLFEDGHLYFAYHHKVLWDVNVSSSPVIDSNYNPSLYYFLGEFSQWQTHLGILEHLSNGQVAERSRGLNMSYLHFLRRVQFQKISVSFGIKVFTSYKIDNGSSDIVEYMGIWKGLMRIENFLSFIHFSHSLELRLSPGGSLGTDTSNGNLEVGLKLSPIHNSKFNFYIQYFNGRNEYLLDYKEYKQRVRGGVSFDL